MIDTFLLDTLRDMPLRGWIFLLLLTLVVVAVNCWAFSINKNRVLLSILILYIGAILCMTVIGRNVEDKMMYRIIPLWSWKKALTNIVEKNEYSLAWQIVLNILMFVPVGYLAYFLTKKNFRKTIIFVVAFSLFIEVLQLVFHLGLFEWDDVLHNTIGYVLGAGVGRLCIKIRAKSSNR